MGFNYAPLWKLLIDKKMTKTQLRVQLSLSPNTIARMGKGEYVSMDILDRICKHLGCRIEDIIEHVSDEE